MNVITLEWENMTLNHGIKKLDPGSRDQHPVPQHGVLAIYPGPNYTDIRGPHLSREETENQPTHSQFLD